MQINRNISTDNEQYYCKVINFLLIKKFANEVVVFFWLFIFLCKYFKNENWNRHSTVYLLYKFNCLFMQHTWITRNSFFLWIIFLFFFWLLLLFLLLNDMCIPQMIFYPLINTYIRTHPGFSVYYYDRIILHVPDYKHLLFFWALFENICRLLMSQIINKIFINIFFCLYILQHDAKC